MARCEPVAVYAPPAVETRRRLGGAGWVGPPATRRRLCACCAREARVWLWWNRQRNGETQHVQGPGRDPQFPQHRLEESYGTRRTRPSAKSRATRSGIRCSENVVLVHRLRCRLE